MVAVLTSFHGLHAADTRAGAATKVYVFRKCGRHVKPYHYEEVSCEKMVRNNEGLQPPANAFAGTFNPICDTLSAAPPKNAATLEREP